MKTIIIIIACLFVSAQYIRGQSFDKSYENSEVYEEHFRNFFTWYSDAISDTLFHNGKRYTFRTSPVSLKKGYTNIFDDTIIYIMGDINMGKKGYILTWVIQNDSLFIRNIYRNGKVNATNAVSKIEEFTECHYKDGLLYIHWVSGDFGLLTNDRKNNRNEWYNEVENGGYLIKLKKGKFITIENDTRNHKN
jgi:hypothetical protein